MSHKSWHCISEERAKELETLGFIVKEDNHEGEYITQYIEHDGKRYEIRTDWKDKSKYSLGPTGGEFRPDGAKDAKTPEYPNRIGTPTRAKILAWIKWTDEYRAKIADAVQAHNASKDKALALYSRIDGDRKVNVEHLNYYIIERGRLELHIDKNTAQSRLQVGWADVDTVKFFESVPLTLKTKE